MAVPIIGRFSFLCALAAAGFMMCSMSALPACGPPLDAEVVVQELALQVRPNPGPVPGIPGPNGLGHYGPFATIRRANEVVRMFQRMGYPNTIQFHNGNGQYVLPRK
jgi:hypothetical protein